MVPLLFMLKVSKFIGAAGVLAVVVDSVAYFSFRRRNLLPFDNPIDEDEEVLARFAVDKDEDDGGFFFALATAPAHVEDKLRDAWLEFAEQDASRELDRATDPGESTESTGVSPAEEQKAAKGLEAEKTSGNSSNENPESRSSHPGEIKEGVSEENLESTEASTSDFAAESGSPNSPDSGITFSEAELVSYASDKDEAEDGTGSASNPGGGDESNVKGEGQSEETAPEVQLASPPAPASLPGQQTPPRLIKKDATVPATLQFDLPRKARQFGKVAMEAMIRGIERVSEIIEESGEEAPHVAAWQNAFHPEERLRFWSEPDTELKLAQDANVKVFRMGVDWSRVMPVEPVDGLAKAVNWQAVKRYRFIIQRVHDHGMRVMLTLFHHSLPIWAAKIGGWKNEKMVDYFILFTKLVVEKYADLVDFWVTFNEPHIFAGLTYCAGAWPGGDPNLLETATSVLPKGVFKVVMAAMANAHVQAYDIIHENSKKISKRASVGAAHHVSFMRPYGLFDVPIVMLSDWMTRFPFIDSIIKKMDYIGINYYGQEVISAPGLKNVENDEYSESGRGVYPDGLFRVLTTFHDRYKKFDIPYIITENGVSDSTDYIRRPYITEHLLALRAAMAKGVPVQGYCFWTTSDNWEWADGYGPKFGLVAVDRHNDLARSPRPSYYLLAEIAKTGIVTKQQRDQAWEELQSAAMEGKKRPFCREVDGNGLMYSGGLDVPIELPFVQRDWRFGHYKMDGLQDPLSRFVRFVFTGAFLGRKQRSDDRVGTPGKGLQSKGVPDLRLTEVEEKSPAFA